jgi:hypothetical protein
MKIIVAAVALGLWFAAFALAGDLSATVRLSKPAHVRPEMARPLVAAQP